MPTAPSFSPPPPPLPAKPKPDCVVVGWLWLVVGCRGLVSVFCGGLLPRPRPPTNNQPPTTSESVNRLVALDHEAVEDLAHLVQAAVATADDHNGAAGVEVALGELCLLLR